MRVFLVALSAAGLSVPAIAQETPPKTVSPVLVMPVPKKLPPPDAKVDMAGDDRVDGDFVAIWPADAYKTRRNGRVRLSCLVDAHGLAEWCRVTSETPAGNGFGKAALELRPTFVLTPATGADGKPVNRVMSIGISFRAPVDSGADTEWSRARVKPGENPTAVLAYHSAYSNALAMRPVTMVDNPIWIQTASFDDVARAYPTAAGGVAGYAAAHCRVVRSGKNAGALSECQVIKEAPDDLGFGAAAQALAAKFRLDPASLARAPRGAPLWVDVPIRFPQPRTDKDAERLVSAPLWLSSFDAAPKVFPPEAADQGVTSGRGVARCMVAAGGAVTACLPEPGDPQGLGFSEAVAKLAGTMRMNLWSADAAPVEGGVVYVAMRLNLRESRR